MKINNNKGMTLIEIVFSILILTITITGFSMIFTQAALQASKSNVNTATVVTGRKYADNYLFNSSITTPDEVTIENLDTAESKKVKITYKDGTIKEAILTHSVVTVNDDNEEVEGREIKYHIFK